MEIFQAIALSLFSGLFASLITVLITRYFENKKSLLEYKKKVFQDLIAFRGDLVDSAENTGNFQVRRDLSRVISANKTLYKTYLNELTIVEFTIIQRLSALTHISTYRHRNPLYESCHKRCESRSRMRLYIDTMRFVEI